MGFQLGVRIIRAVSGSSSAPMHTLAAFEGMALSHNELEEQVAERWVPTTSS
jgi:hypothetical protein